MNEFEAQSATRRASPRGSRPAEVPMIVTRGVFRPVYAKRGAVFIPALERVYGPDTGTFSPKAFLFVNYPRLKLWVVDLNPVLVSGKKERYIQSHVILSEFLLGAVMVLRCFGYPKVRAYEGMYPSGIPISSRKGPNSSIAIFKNPFQPDAIPYPFATSSK